MQLDVWKYKIRPVVATIGKTIGIEIYIMSGHRDSSSSGSVLTKASSITTRTSQIILTKVRKMCSLIQ